jgi:hypothetical protein
MSDLVHHLRHHGGKRGPEAAERIEQLEAALAGRALPESDASWAARIKAECNTNIEPDDHAAADNLLCELLEALGYTETVTAWDEVGKWYE